jgi:hypothetical protein
MRANRKICYTYNTEKEFWPWTLHFRSEKFKVKVRKAYNRRNLGQQYREELKWLSKQLLLAKKSAQELFLKSILKHEGKCWTEFYKYVQSRMVMNGSLRIQ